MGWRRLARAATRAPGIKPVYRAYLRRRVPGIAASDEYDRQMAAVLERHLTPESNCVDVGAHAGDALDEILPRAPHGTHHAFEPLPEFAARLRRRYPGVLVHEVALGSTTGTTEFVHVVTNPAYSGLRRREYARQEKLDTITVEVARLDDVLPPDLPVAFVKIDVEGGEVDVLRGAARTLRTYRPLVVFEYGQLSTPYYDDSGPEALHDLLAEAGMATNTMLRWLAGQGPYSRDELVDHYAKRRGFYLMAQPGSATSPV